MQTKNRWLTGCNMDVARALLHAGLQQLIDQNCGHRFVRSFLTPDFIANGIARAHRPDAPPSLQTPTQKPRTPACQYTHMGGQPAIREPDETKVPKRHEFKRRTESTHFRQADIKIRPCFYACRADAKILGLAPPKPPCCWAGSCVSQ